MASYDILIVDDSITTSRLIEMHLEAMGYTVAGIAVDANNALKMVEKQPPDLVLMDINLGEGPNGIVAADTIMNRYRVPVIYVTAYSDVETVDSAKQSMPYGFINKPLRGSDLRVNIELAMARAHKMLPMSSSNYAVGDAAGNNEYLNLSEALDHLVSGVIMVTEELKVTYQNRAAVRMLRHHTALTEEVAGIQVGEHDFAALLVFHLHGDRSGDNVKQVIRRVTLADDQLLGWIHPPMAMFQKPLGQIVLQSQ